MQTYDLHALILIASLLSNLAAIPCYPAIGGMIPAAIESTGRIANCNYLMLPQIQVRHKASAIPAGCLIVRCYANRHSVCICPPLRLCDCLSVVHCLESLS